VHLKYPNYAGTLVTGGGLVFNALLDGTVAAYDDTTLDELWKINVGSGFSAPPMTFEVSGTVRCNRVGTEPGLPRPARQHAGAARAAPRAGTVCIRAVRSTPSAACLSALGRRRHAKADWQFTTANARVKLKRLYRQFE
jgi:outer membrane protein assembly factor BamB